MKVYPAGTAFRPATDDDSWDLIALIAACWAEYPGCVVDIHGECRELLAPASAFNDAGGELWVLTDLCHHVVASVGWLPRPDEVLELERLYVARRWRRQGVARRLAEEVEEAAARRGSRATELWSDTRFTDAHALYARLGYTRTGRDRDLHDLSHTREWHFTKALRSGHPGQ